MRRLNKLSLISLNKNKLKCISIDYFNINQTPKKVKKFKFLNIHCGL